MKLEDIPFVFLLIQIREKEMKTPKNKIHKFLSLYLRFPSLIISTLPPPPPPPKKKKKKKNTKHNPDGID
jgi:hypothetical protein